jgi:hypothetical protein
VVLVVDGPSLPLEPHATAAGPIATAAAKPIIAATLFGS